MKNLKALLSLKRAKKICDMHNQQKLPFFLYNIQAQQVHFSKKVVTASTSFSKILSWDVAPLLSDPIHDDTIIQHSKRVSKILLLNTKIYTYQIKSSIHLEYFTNTKLQNNSLLGRYTPFYPLHFQLSFLLLSTRIHTRINPTQLRNDHLNFKIFSLLLRFQLSFFSSRISKPHYRKILNSFKLALLSKSVSSLVRQKYCKMLSRAYITQLPRHSCGLHMRTYLQTGRCVARTCPASSVRMLYKLKVFLCQLSLEFVLFLPVQTMSYSI